MLIQLPCQAGGDNRIAQACGRCQMMLSGKDVTSAVSEPHCCRFAALLPPPLSRRGWGGVCCLMLFNAAACCHTEPELGLQVVVLERFWSLPELAELSVPAPSHRGGKEVN